MVDQLYSRADDFDFFRTELDGDLLFQFGDQLQRARAILANRTEPELDYGLDSLDWLLREGSDRFMREFLAQEDVDSVFMNRAKSLKCLVSVFDLGDQSAFPDATWPEYFALLAVACVAEELAYEGRSLEDIYGWIVTEEPLTLEVARAQRTQQRWEQALESLEAVCYAEHLQDVQKLEQRLSDAKQVPIEQLREWGRRGKQATMRPYNELRESLITHYEKNLAGRPKQSNRNAAKRLYKLYQSDVDAVLRTDDPEKQIEKWIGQYRRSNDS